jgi:hypothetical protein
MGRQALRMEAGRPRTEPYIRGSEGAGPGGQPGRPERGIDRMVGTVGIEPTTPRV